MAGDRTGLATAAGSDMAR